MSRVQTGDGYAAYVAGRRLGVEIGVTSDAQASWWGGRGVGTVPHSLIAAYGGNTVLAATKFAEWAGEDVNVTVLVDFENDSVATALEVARALGPRLWGVRLDTSGQLVDRSLWDDLGDFDPRGVNERLVRTSVFRLAREGWLAARPVGRQSLYRLTADGARRFEQAYRRIYAPPADAWDDSWEVVLADGPSSDQRRALRQELQWEGFGIFGASVFTTKDGLIKLAWTGTSGKGGSADSRLLSTAVDLDNAADGNLEVLAGKTAYRADGSILWDTNLPDGFPGVGDFDEDGVPEVVLVATGTVWVLNGTGESNRGARLAGYLDYQGIAASAPRTKPEGAVPKTTKIVVYNGAEAELTETIDYLQRRFDVTVETATDPAMRADIVITIGRDTPDLEAPPLSVGEQ